ncbi:helix-turn-helix transcriptional regulator [uncultured Thiothrix sp.]|uniref:helix-turn-helix domain-containing protein n=1 Tax=uncultured Thiothrix sp. TaxID=223185 RepID=UPI00261B4980|nr:helix-turn-helix transcriptional regulator [uncultured Thiothrix sp.]
MSGIDLAGYIQERMDALGLSVTAAAERSGVSRQTWHKLMRADIQEAKLSTLMRVARTLETPAPDLLSIYFYSGRKRANQGYAISQFM